jgi:hypothetical protein
MESPEELLALATVKVHRLTDREMEQLGSKLANDYIEQLFWTSLKILFEEMFLSR